MWRAMLDTDQPSTLRFSTGMLATYADLADAALAGHLAQLHGQVLWIDRGLGDPAGVATILDVEAHAVTPPQVPGWLDRRHAAGARYLTVYCNRSTLAEVKAEAGQRSFYHWVARLDGVATVPGFTPGESPAAVQVMGAAALGVQADYSLVFQPGWNPRPAEMLTSAQLAGLISAETHLRDALAILATVK